jgi:hypothetical protein
MRSLARLPTGFQQGFPQGHRSPDAGASAAAKRLTPRRRNRHRLLSALLGVGLLCSTPAALAAENIVLVSGAFRRSIPVADMELLAKKGQAQGLLADLLRFSNQNPVEVGKLSRSARRP